MEKLNIPENVTVDEFFNKHVPSQFSESTSGIDMSAMAGKNFTLQFNVDDKKYCLNIKDGKDLEIIKGGVDKPIVMISLSEPDWRDAVTGKIEGVIDQFSEPAQVADAARYNALLSIKGKMKLELKKGDGTMMPITMVFNGEENPAVTLRLAMSDWIDIQNKKTDGQSLFMAGKMELDGDMMFAIALQQLM